MLWSARKVRLRMGGNLRECQGWMNRDNALRWCNRHGIEFVDVDELMQDDWSPGVSMRTSL